jgi:hypothetical protein
MGVYMGASSVTGIGCGSAGKISLSTNSNNSSDSRVPLSISSLVGPRIIAAGVVTINNNESQVYFTSPSGSVNEYAVFLQDNSRTAIVATPLSSDEQNSNWSFTIQGKSKSIVSWMVVKLGII